MPIKPITPCLWFDRNAEEAATFYTSIFPDARIGNRSYYTKEGFDVHGMPEGTLLTIEFELDGQPFLGLNGGPVFRFNEAISFVIPCKDQAEVDRYWEQLSQGGDPSAQQCGWLKDRFGVSWQVVPQAFTDLLAKADRAQNDRMTKAMLQMKKLDMAALQRAFDGN